jgi:glyoxylase-like metal-dependent hydrolase (beta-lactamase superfamily II)
MFKSFFRLGKLNRFKPDFYVDEGYNFSAYGFDAMVLNLPGHSKGSIGILTARGDLFCGDLLVNTGKPDKNTLVDDPAELDASVEKLKHLQVNTVYPGHGQPFPMELFTRTQ